MDKPIRILHVVGSLGLGGIQSYLMNLYRHVDKTCIQFDFAVHIKSDISYEEEILSMGGKIFYMPDDCFEKHKWLTYVSFWKSFFEKHQEYVIVHGHMRSTAFLYMTLARFANRKVIAHSHATDNGKGLSGFVKDTLQLPVRFIANYFMGCSKNATTWMFGKKCANSRNCYVLRNGIDASRYAYNKEVRDKLRKSFSIPSDALVVGNVGRLVSQKNQSHLIKVHEALLKIRPDSWLVIVGDGPLHERLQNEAADIPNVLLLGARTDIPNVIQAFDVFVMPSGKEGLGIAAIEAQAAGLPTIVSEIIPQEAYITSLVRKIDLQEPPSTWANCIFKTDVSRSVTTNLIKTAGYDIASVSDWLCDFYVNILKE